MSQEKDSELMFISDDEESLFYRVPRRILSFIDGCPSKVCQVIIGYDDDSERITFCVSEVAEDKQRFTISVPQEKIFRLIEAEGIAKTNFEE